MSTPAIVAWKNSNNKYETYHMFYDGDYNYLGKFILDNSDAILKGNLDSVLLKNDTGIMRDFIVGNLFENHIKTLPEESKPLNNDDKTSLFNEWYTNNEKKYKQRG